MDLAGARRAPLRRLDPAAEPSALEWPLRILAGLGRAAVEQRRAVRSGAGWARNSGRGQRDQL